MRREIGQWGEPVGAAVYELSLEKLHQQGVGIPQALRGCQGSGLSLPKNGLRSFSFLVSQDFSVCESPVPPH